MTTNEERKPLREVWLLTDSPHGYHHVEDRVFAELGEKEISEIASEIGSAYGFKKAIRPYVEDFIRKELANGETQIYLNPEDEDMTEFFIYKVKLDSGTDWSGANESPEPDEEDKVDVFKGDEIYASHGYYGDIDTLYSSEWLDYLYPLTIE